MKYIAMYCCENTSTYQAGQTFWGDFRENSSNWALSRLTWNNHILSIVSSPHHNRVIISCNPWHWHWFDNFFAQISKLDFSSKPNRLFKQSNPQGVWSGHFGRDHFQLHKEVEELFLYSNSDYYLPQKYLESEVLEKRRREGARFSATR